MSNRPVDLESIRSAAKSSPATSPATAAAAEVPSTGIERRRSDARKAPDRARQAAQADPGAIEYASWLSALRQTPA